MTTVKPDWRFVEVDQTSFLDTAFREKHGVKACGVIYLIDANLHIHICSFTPNLEAWPVQAFVDWGTYEELSEDQQEFELELMNSEEPCSYFDLDVLKNPTMSAAKYVPEQEADETFMAYRLRVGETVREELQGNPLNFIPEEKT